MTLLEIQQALCKQEITKEQAIREARAYEIEKREIKKRLTKGGNTEEKLILGKEIKELIRFQEKLDIIINYEKRQKFSTKYLEINQALLRGTISKSEALKAVREALFLIDTKMYEGVGNPCLNTIAYINHIGPYAVEEKDRFEERRYINPCSPKTGMSHDEKFSISKFIGRLLDNNISFQNEVNPLAQMEIQLTEEIGNSPNETESIGRLNEETITPQEGVKKKYKLLPSYERAVWLYRAANKSNRKLIELSDLDDDTELKKTVTPREVNTSKFKPYISMIEYIDSVAYNESMRLEERLLELGETKSLRARAYEAKETDLTEKVYNETNSWLERVIFDLESIKFNREAVQARIKNRNFLLDWEITQLLNRGKLSPEEGLRETKAAEAGIEDLVFQSVPLDIWNQELMYYQPIIEIYGLEELIIQRGNLFSLHAQLDIKLKKEGHKPGASTTSANVDRVVNPHEVASNQGNNTGKTLLQDSELNMFAEIAGPGGKLTAREDGKYIVNKSIDDVLEYFQGRGYNYTASFLHRWLCMTNGSEYSPGTLVKKCKDYPTLANQKAKEARKRKKIQIKESKGNQRGT